MRTLNIGLDPETDHEHELEHQEDGHTDHDDSGARQRTGGSNEHQDGNTTWAQVYKTVQNT